MKRVHEFEALRGFLALWVVVGHCFRYTGYTHEELGHFSLLVDPGFAVDAFIMLSGFVIFDLLDTKHEAYGPFITRRFFRIFPLYVVALIVGAALAPMMLEWVQALPWRPSFGHGARLIDRSSIDLLPQHFLVHLTGLHGLVPDSLLPLSQYAIVGQAWSISVEWQFYLIAPLLYFALMKRPLVLCGIVAAFIYIHRYNSLGEGFSINQAQYFLIGILCYFAYKRLPQLGRDRLLLASLLAIAAAVWFTTRPVSLCVWTIFFAAALHSRNGTGNLISDIAAMKWAQFLGRISYSVYLLHMFVIMAVSMSLLRYYPGVGHGDHIRILLPISIIAIIAFSWLTYLAIEKPGMDFGRVVAKKLFSRTARAATNPV